MLNQLFSQQRSALNRFFDLVDLADGQKILDKLLKCRGIILFSGVGKSGHIAEKVAATFSSIGSRAFFLSPANALHGDIGFVGPEDCLVCLSKSGETQELLALIPHIKKRRASTIAIVSKPGSTLAKLSDLSIHLPVEKEICPHDLVPTTSTAVQLIFGDCLAVALMKAKNFSVADFASNHPGGLLGRKITLKVKDLMLRNSEIPLCRPDDPLIEVIHELSGKRCGCLLVVDERGLLKGIFTDGDLRRAIQTQGPDALKMKLEKLMTLNPKTIAADRLAFEAMKEMEDPGKPITVLPVLEQGRVVGLLRMHDILQKEFS
jgi:arabinose-5-phosphate isomerase